MKKILTILSALALVFTLSSCGSSSDEKKEIENSEMTFTDSYGLHYENLNYLTQQSNQDGIYYSNMVEGLVEVDNFGRTIGTGATDWTSKINDDGTETWTFNLRKGIQWLDPANDLSEYAEVTANDYVSAMQYILNPNNASETASIPASILVGAEEYMAALGEGKVGDFSKVGVKALDDYTLEYTIKQPTPYFLSYLSYSPWYPVNGTYLKEMGTDFGRNGESLLINGPYYITRDDLNSRIELTTTGKYWNQEIVKVPNLRFIFVSADAGADWPRLKYENGELSQLRLDPNDQTGYDKYVLGPDGTGTPSNPYSPGVYSLQPADKYSFGYFINAGRAYFTDGVAYTASNHTESSKMNTTTALQNASFRQAILWGLDVTEFNVRYSPEDPDQRTRNVYTPAGLAFDKNGKDYIDYYYEVMAENNNSTAEEMRVLLADGTEYYEDDKKAEELFAKAKEELTKEGITFPVLIEFLGSTNNDLRIYQQAMLEKMNDTFGEYVNVQFMPINGQEQYDSVYRVQDYDIYGMTGWGADFDDPKTYADTFNLDGGFMLDFVGLAEGQGVPEDIRQKILGEYTELIDKADAYNTYEDTPKRLRAYAEGEYELLNNGALFIPAYTRSAESLYVTTVVPKSLPNPMSGLSSSMYKYLRLHDGEMTKDQYENYLKEHEAKKQELGLS